MRLCLSLLLSLHDSDGKLKEADQILAINGQALDQTVTHQQAISILQSAADRVQLTVARGPVPQLASPAASRTPSAASRLSANPSSSRTATRRDHSGNTSDIASCQTFAANLTNGHRIGSFAQRMRHVPIVPSL